MSNDKKRPQPSQPRPTGKPGTTHTNDGLPPPERRSIDRNTSIEIKPPK